MKLSLLACCLVPTALFLAGCGSIDEEREPAQYPQGGVGINTAEELNTAPHGSASLEAIPPAPPGDLQGQSAAGELAIGADPNHYADTDPSALTDFKPALDPYGSWVEDGTYGTVWVPSRTVVGNDFAPYVSAGHWTYDHDYVWVSDYDWGWAPFHYGRWVYIAGQGWSWIPGREYSGAWVTWRTGYDGYGYVGWAPYPPTWYWSGGYAVGLYAVPPAPYVFCPTGDVFAPVVASHIVTGSQVPVVAGPTRPYVPATPTVNAGGDRQAAHPSVATSGPPPGRLGLQAAQIPAPPHQMDRGLLKAQQFASPTSAQLAGGRAPVGTQVRPQRLPSSGPEPMSAARAPIATGPRSILPPYATSSSFGAVARAPSYSPSSQGVSAPYARPMPSYSSNFAPPHFSSTPSSAFSAPHFQSSGSSSFSSSQTQPQYHSSPSYAQPHYASPSYSAPQHFQSSGSSGFGVSPSYHSSAPSFHSSAPSYSAPSFHSSAPSVGHSAPSMGSMGRGRR